MRYFAIRDVSCIPLLFSVKRQCRDFIYRQKDDHFNERRQRGIR